eukprot:GFYU01004316.1.p1 GENE.GFYU01004316.1~~GFYU01004316.1.p1  ORF type:complete len:1457 (+),score=347.58 GFYU01004316.1:158-4528(+)
MADPVAPTSPAGGPKSHKKLRQSSHLVLEMENGEVHLISSLSTRSDTQIITVDPSVGSLRHTGIPGIDVFPSEDAALTHVCEGDFKKIKTKTPAYAVLGHVAIGKEANIIVATRIKEDMGVLPGPHIVCTVMETKWIKMKVSYPIQITGGESKNFTALKDFPLDTTHIYCETYDLTHAFPSAYHPEEYDEEFVWNEFLAAPFAKVGLRKWCAVLVQGFSDSRKLKYQDKEFHYSIIARKSQMHPGTRYGARGLNERAGAGNEMEQQQLVWTREEGKINWTSYVWRRGSVPVWWKTELKSAVAEPVITIGHDPYRGAEIYWRRMLRRNRSNQVTCFNLLHCSPGHGEFGLSEHFQHSVKHVKKALDADIGVINIDWHANMKALGPDRAIAGFWSSFSGSAQRFDMTQGTLHHNDTPSSVHERFASGEPHVNNMDFISEQDGVIRVNCADSLDRTNLAIFYAMFHVLAEQLRRLGIMPSPAHTAGTKWPFLEKELSHMESMLTTELLSPLAEMFVYGGDICSMLYTNSPAMHTKLIRAYSKRLGEAPHNTKIVLQRRYQNVTNDLIRQTAYEMVLGLYRDKYFPSTITQLRNDWVSGYSSFVLKPVPSVFKGFSPDRLLVDAPEDYAWVCETDHESLDIYIFLREPCLVTELVFTVRHGVSEKTAPFKYSLFTGIYLDDMKTIVKESILPMCPDRTRLYCQVPTLGQGGLLYDYDSGESQGLARLVRVSLMGHDAAKHITFGKVELYGMIPETTAEKRVTRKFTQVAGSDHRFHQFGEEDDDIDDVHIEDKDQFDSVDGAPGGAGVIIGTASQDATPASNAESTPIDGDAGAPATDAVADPESGANDDDDDDDENIGLNDLSGLSVSGEQDGKASPPPGAAPPATKPSSELTVPPPAIARVGSPGSIGSPGNSPIGSPSSRRTTPRDRSTVRFTTPVRGLSVAHSDPYAMAIKGKVMKGSTIETLSFKDLLQLELIRLRSNTTPSQRDATLLMLELKPETYNPNLRVTLREENQSDVGRTPTFQKVYCTKCSEQTKAGQRNTCKYCTDRFCSKSECFNMEGEVIVEWGWTKPMPVCRKCSASLGEVRKMVEDIQQLTQQQALERAMKDASGEGIRDVTDLRWLIAQSRAAKVLRGQSKHSSSTGGDMSLSEFPDAAVVVSVPTDVESPPIESILAPIGILPPEMSWRAPTGVTSVEVVIVLAMKAIVKEISLGVKLGGYTELNVPSIDIFAGDKLSEYHNIGRWDLALNEDNVLPSGTTTTYKLDKPTSCRIISLQMSLPDTPEGVIKSPDEVPFLHMQHLQILGHAASPTPANTFNNASEKHLYDRVVFGGAPVQRAKLAQQYAEFRLGGRILDVGLDAMDVDGFCFPVTHDEKEGVVSQVKTIRITGFKTKKASGQIVSQHDLGTFTVPKVAPRTPLYYDFPERVNVNLITFEFLKNYGGETTSSPKPSLFRILMQ